MNAARVCGFGWLSAAMAAFRYCVSASVCWCGYSVSSQQPRPVNALLTSTSMPSRAALTAGHLLAGIDALRASIRVGGRLEGADARW